MTTSPPSSLVGWQDIATAPRDGTLVRLRSPKFDPAEHLFWWDKKNKRWATILFAVARKVNAWWAKDEEQPTLWRLPDAPPDPSS